VSQKLSVPATTFLSHVDSAMAWLEWIATSIRSDEFVRGRIDWNGLSQPQRTIVQKKLDLPVPEQRLMLNALYITVVAAFEDTLQMRPQLLYTAR